MDIPQPLAGFVLPLAVSSFKVVIGGSWLVGTIFLARLYGVPLGAADYFTIVAAGMALSFATPGVPNGAFLLLAPLLASLGLPPAGVALLIAVDAIPDLFATASNVTGDFAAVAIVRRLVTTTRLGAPLHRKTHRLHVEANANRYRVGPCGLRVQADADHRAPGAGARGRRLRHGLSGVGRLPGYIRPVALAVASGECERGIVLGGSGNGEAIVANRVKGVRCALCWNVESARLGRLHNDANVISIGERMVSREDAVAIVDTWLTTPFEGGRHVRRIQMIDDI